MGSILTEASTTTDSRETQPPLDSTEAIEFVWICWRILGMHAFERHRRFYWIYSLLINVICCILCPLHMAANLFYKSDFLGFTGNLAITISVVFSSVKQYIIFYYTRRNLSPIREHLKVLDKRAAEHSEEYQIVAREVRFCRRMFTSIAIVYGCGLGMFAISGFIHHQLVFDGWVPFEYNSSTSLYTTAFVIQLMCITTVAIAELSNDTYSICYLVLLVAHVRALNVRVARIGTDPSRSLEQNNDELVKCVCDHKVCTRFFKLLSPVVAGTMFAQFLITSVVLCITGVSFLISDPTLAQQVSYLFYISGLTIEILPCCWFAEELNAESHRLTTALYHCQWYEQDLRFRRTLIIFMQRSQKAYIISAGNLAPVALPTIRKIIQFAFSMFTVINRIK